MLVMMKSVQQMNIEITTHVERVMHVQGNDAAHIKNNMEYIKPGHADTGLTFSVINVSKRTKMLQMLPICLLILRKAQDN